MYLLPESLKGPFYVPIIQAATGNPFIDECRIGMSLDEIVSKLDVDDCVFDVLKVEDGTVTIASEDIADEWWSRNESKLEYWQKLPDLVERFHGDYWRDQSDYYDNEDGHAEFAHDVRMGR